MISLPYRLDNACNISATGNILKEVVRTFMYVAHILADLYHVILYLKVLKWTMQQPWYEDDFELNTKMANTLGTNRKLTRMRELFDQIITTGQVPDISTYVILIKTYLADESSDSIDEAYAMYNQMEQLGGYQQPAAVAFSLFQSFTDRKGGAHLRHLHQADALFESMKKKGTSWCMGLTSDNWRAMYTALMHMHSIQGNVERVHELAADMKEAALGLHPDCYTALIRVCVKDGNTAEAESVFKDLVAAGYKPDWRAYVALIQTYGTAGLSENVRATFDEMETKEVHINVNVFEAVIEALTKAGDGDGALAALEKAEDKFASVLHSSYNLLMEWYKSKDMLLEVEEIFNRMKEKKCRPNLQAFNNVIDSYILRGQLDRAEGMYDEMMDLQGFNPNQKTCSLMIEAFGRAGLQEKVKGVYEYTTKRKMTLSDEAMACVAEAVGKKEVAQVAEDEKVKSLKLIAEQREMLVGVLLGGAKVDSFDKNRTYEITFELGDETQAGSILIGHLYDMFADWAQQAPRTEVHDDLGKKIHRFSTVSHGSLRFYAHQYRPEGQPVIPKLIHRWLNPLSLAYWYMYGGEKCKETGGLILNALPYTSKELTLVVKALKARTVDCVIKKRKAGNVLLFKDESAVWLWKLMEPHVLDELKDLLRPDEPRGEDGSNAFNGDSESKMTEEADLAMEGTGTEVSVKVGT